MNEINWGNFKAKFNNKEQSSFEWLCYLLFCIEFDKNKGVFRYKNQSGIETNQIYHSNEVIGWQAKYYDNKLSDHKKELIETLEKSKRDYPDITKIIFFTNTEWGQGKKENDSKIKKEVEKIALDLNIKIEWRTASFFESPFVTINNKDIAKYFFSLEKSISDLIEDKIKHTECILFSIKTHIYFNENKIEIDRTKIVNDLKKELYAKNIIILSGVGGVGKTAVIKKLYDEIKNKNPIYLFKATEFNINDINKLFDNFSFNDFVDAHEYEKEKIIIIDSVENSLYFENKSSLNNFITILIKNDWKIIFTARGYYLEDLYNDFIDIYQITPSKFHIDNLNTSELNILAFKNDFEITSDEKLQNLIKNPFYLNYYLQFYKKNEKFNYIQFKEKLWNSIIKKGNPGREQLFLTIAYKKANENQFFINFDGSNFSLLREIVQDEIIGYETAGYFITHDIYEELALEKIIDSEFIKKENNEDFFNKIGNTLSIRRSFRNWMSEKLLLDDIVVKQFIEEIIEGRDNWFWNDEILVSILLSDYSENFFDIFKNKILNKNQDLIKRITFMLRIACKEVDSDIFKQLGIKTINIFSIQYILTQPKGNGWNSFIKFIFNNMDEIGIENIDFIIPVIYEYNNKYKEGETVKLSSLIAIKYYKFLIENNYIYSNDDFKIKLLHTIFNGASEIKEELEIVFKEIIKNKWKKYRDPYYIFSKEILTTFSGVVVSKTIPEYVLKLNELFFSADTKKLNNYNEYHDEIEKYFGIDSNIKFYPVSAYQTQIFFLLRFSFQNTIDFILKFTNNSINSFTRSRLAKNEIEEIEIFIDKNSSVKQYISNRLWCMHRGTQVAPDFLKSIHMALEKYLFEDAKVYEVEKLENILLYLIKNSKSSSITSIVASIVIAYPEKTFNIAKILFRTKELFFYDKNRLVLDQSSPKSFLGIFGFDTKNKIHEDERLESDKLKHRTIDLEFIFLKYQYFKENDITELDFEYRLKTLYKILDIHHSKLKKIFNESELDKNWKLCLARIDKRIIEVISEKTDVGTTILFIPKIEKNLKEYSDKSLEKYSNATKYLSLKMWADFKLENNEKHKQHTVYENDPVLALNQAKEIINLCQENKNDNFKFMNQSTPTYVFSTLIKYYFEYLSIEDKVYCKNYLIDIASLFFKSNYQYQAIDGVQISISILPILIREFPEDNDSLKTILLLSLFDDTSIGFNGKFSNYAIQAIRNILWEISPDDANSILCGYLSLKIKYDKLKSKIRQNNYEKFDLIVEFLKEEDYIIKKVISNEISFNDLKNISDLKLGILNTVFQLVPLKTENKDHKKIVLIIIDSFVKVMLSEKSKNEVDYVTKHTFLERFAYFILSSHEDDIEIYLNYFISNFKNSEIISDLLKEIILAEDLLNTYSVFWKIWDLFYNPIVELCKKENDYWYMKDIIKSYLFANTTWEEKTISWNTLKNNDTLFFSKIIDDIGYSSHVFYSISKLLNDIGSRYDFKGVIWINKMLENEILYKSKPESNTIYYIENFIKKYIYKNRECIRKTKKLKIEVISILNYLVENNSVSGYMLRESIL